MEKVQKVPKEIKQVGTPDQHGNNAYSIAFTDGSSGFFKCKDQNLFYIGQPSEFMLSKEMGRSGKEYYKISRVPKEENNFTNDKKSFKAGEKFMCLSYAKDIFIAFNGKMPSPVEVAEYGKILYEEMADEEKTTLAPEPKKEVDPNDLPF